MTVANRFEDLIVWQLAVRVRDGVYRLTESGRASDDEEFRQQIMSRTSSWKPAACVLAALRPQEAAAVHWRTPRN